MRGSISNSVLRRKGEWFWDDLPLHIIIMPSVMSLELLFDIVQHNYRGDEIDGLARGQEIEIAATVPTPVAIATLLVKLQ